jgi:hypothetical protein
MTDPAPYLRLWTAVVVQAVADASHHNPLQREALQWIASPFFLGLCEWLDLNANAIRAQIHSPHILETLQTVGRRPLRSREDA